MRWPKHGAIACTPSINKWPGSRTVAVSAVVPDVLRHLRWWSSCAIENEAGETRDSVTVVSGVRSRRWWVGTRTIPKHVTAADCEGYTGAGPGLGHHVEKLPLSRLKPSKSIVVRETERQEGGDQGDVKTKGYPGDIIDAEPRWEARISPTWNAEGCDAARIFAERSPMFCSLVQQPDKRVEPIEFHPQGIESRFMQGPTCRSERCQCGLAYTFPKR
ncbi:hypothetical protein F5I97DRAFT_1830258 [Phlebopus sp. FC_14]|nr:hypothetical protein F5I97DRAFT_1830258 [Phlebopus sp. FC_14]